MSRSKWSWRRWGLVGAGALCLIVVLNGCARTAYYLQAARGQLELVTQRVPIDEALADPELSADVRQRLELAFDAREFAASALALPDNKSYRTYVQLDRRYVLWNVVAAPEFSVEPKIWCFPIAGCVSYRGYFREASARKEALALQEEGLDAFFGGVGAYSTLGRLADPILSSMLTGSELSIVGVMFHELAHQVLYRPSDSAFNESFASFVEREGLRRYLAARDRDGDYDSFVAGLARREEFATLVSSARKTLAEVYAQPLDEQAMREAKALAIDQLRADYAELKEAQWGGYAGYDGWFSRDLNNAHIASVSTYNQWVGAFGVWLDDLDGDLPSFYVAVEELAEQDDATVLARLESLHARVSGER
ncbi:MAG: aminopeptidase [Gammaproteobacteria bacterium]